MVMHEHPDVHTSNHTSCPYMYVHWLLHEHIMLDTYKDGFFFKKKPNSGYDYMHIQVLPGFISGFKNIYIWATLVTMV